MHSQCYARCHSTLGARAYFFYVTKFLRIQCTRNSRVLQSRTPLALPLLSFATVFGICRSLGAFEVVNARTPVLLPFLMGLARDAKFILIGIITVPTRTPIIIIIIVIVNTAPGRD